MARYIDADELKNKLISSGAVGDFGQYLIDIQPTADVRPERHERWVWNPNGMDWNLGAFVCSACNCKNDNLPDNRFNPYMYAGSNYCPNCGAKMDGKDGESNG